MNIQCRLIPVGGINPAFMRVGDQFDVRMQALNDDGLPLPPGHPIPDMPNARPHVWFDAQGSPGKVFGMFDEMPMQSGNPHVAIVRCTILKPGAGDVMGSWNNATDDATGPIIMFQPALLRASIITLPESEADGILLGVHLNEMPPDRRIFIIYGVDGPFGWADFFINVERAHAGSWTREAQAGYPGATPEGQVGVRWLWAKGPKPATFTVTAQIFEGNDLLTVATRTFQASDF